MQVYVQPGTKRRVVFARINRKNDVTTYLRRREILEILNRVSIPLTTEQITLRMSQEFWKDPERLRRARQVMSEFHQGFSHPPYVEDVSVKSDAGRARWVITQAGRLALADIQRQFPEAEDLLRRLEVSNPQPAADQTEV